MSAIGHTHTETRSSFSNIELMNKCYFSSFLSICILDHRLFLKMYFYNMLGWAQQHWSYLKQGSRVTLSVAWPVRESQVLNCFPQVLLFWSLGNLVSVKCTIENFRFWLGLGSCPCVRWHKEIWGVCQPKHFKNSSWAIWHLLHLVF